MTATAIGSYASAAALKALIGITDSSDDALLGLTCDRVNQYIESECKQILAPITSAAYLYDGNGLTRMFLPTPAAASYLGIGGLRAVTLVEIASETGGTFETITYSTSGATDAYLRGRKGVGGPFQWLVLSDLPAGSYTRYPKGFANVRITGTGGWTAIPDDVTAMALSVAHRAWNARQSGQQNLVGADDHARPFVAQYFDPTDRRTLMRYTLRRPD